MKSGFTTIELIITIVIISFALLGLYSFFHPAQILLANFSNHAIAMRLGQEGMEVVKNIRDNNLRAHNPWDTGFAVCQNGCQLDYKTGTPVQTPPDALQAYADTFLQVNTDGFYDYSGTASPFKRKITITPISPTGIPTVSLGGALADAYRVEVLVRWDYGTQQLSFTTIGYIYNY